MKQVHLLKLQVAVPRESHECIGEDEEKDCLRRFVHGSILILHRLSKNIPSWPGRPPTSIDPLVVYFSRNPTDLLPCGNKKTVARKQRFEIDRVKREILKIM